MCLTCGCNIPTDSHGDERNITINQLIKAAQVQNITLMDALRNLLKCLVVVAQNWKTYAISTPVKK